MDQVSSIQAGDRVYISSLGVKGVVRNRTKHIIIDDADATLVDLDEPVNGHRAQVVAVTDLYRYGKTRAG